MRQVGLWQHGHFLEEHQEARLSTFEWDHREADLRRCAKGRDVQPLFGDRAVLLAGGEESGTQAQAQALACYFEQIEGRPTRGQCQVGARLTPHLQDLHIRINDTAGGRGMSELYTVSILEG